jgi:phosphatidylserine/phosphatidylglycerophosphate/cardiolipin synthase-like enzyme
VILQRLRDAARRGVHVRILLDDFNTVGQDAQVLRPAFGPTWKCGCSTRCPARAAAARALSSPSLHDFDRMQKRMHNKLFIADSAWGIAGGRNLGDRYFGSGDKQNFVDLDMLAAGRIVRDMAASFDRFWNDPLAYPSRRCSIARTSALRKPEPVGPPIRASRNRSRPCCR